VVFCLRFSLAVSVNKFAVTPRGLSDWHANGNCFNIQLETVPKDGPPYASLPKRPNNQLGHSNGWWVKARPPFSCFKIGNHCRLRTSFASIATQ
jgi:hypothetical protein